MNAIIYTTNTGSTEHYAKLLAQKTGLPIITHSLEKWHKLAGFADGVIIGIDSEVLIIIPSYPQFGI